MVGGLPGFIDLVLGVFFYDLVPSAAPVDLVVTNVTSTTIELMWGAVPETDRNGIITEYQLRFRQQDSVNNTWTYVTVNGSTLRTNLSGLQEFVTYFITISAATVVGIGPFSLEINTTTLEDSTVLWHMFALVYLMTFSFSFQHPQHHLRMSK